MGVTHASMGAQTFPPGPQKTVGRVQPAHLIESGAELLPKSGATSLDFDVVQESSRPDAQRYNAN